MSKEAMKLALEALKDISQMQNHSDKGDSSDVDKAIKAIEAALEAHKALAKQEQKGNQLSCYCPNCEILGRELARIEKQDQGEPVAHTAIFHCPNCEYPHRQVTHITGTAQPPWSPQRKEQGPMAWMCHPFGDDECEFSDHQECENCIPLYTTPPQRTWVGLTNDEINEFAAGCHLSKSVQSAIHEAEAKLKEKNNA